MRTLTTARIEWTDARSFRVYTPYSAEFVAAFKGSTHTRRWDADERCWECRAVDYNNALRVLRRFFDRVEANERPASRPQRGEAMTPYAVLGVRDDAAPEVVEAAYRAMTKLHHPDTNGYTSTARMAAINAAMDAIRAARKHDR